MEEIDKKNNENADKRKYPRIAIKIKCRGEKAKYYSKDLSCDGIFLLKCTGYEPGNILTMEFKVPSDKKLIKVRGIVVWLSKEGTGLRFLTISNDDYEIISNFVDKQLL